MQHSDSQPAHCIFCDIMKGAAEVSVCYEDSSAVAFMDVQPVNQGHTLVVPRQHYESFQDLPTELGMHLFEVAMRLNPVIRKVTGASAMNLIVSSGAAAGQDVYHFHIHLIPRRAGDGFDVPLPVPGLGDAGPHGARCAGGADSGGVARSDAPHAARGARQSRRSSSNGGAALASGAHRGHRGRERLCGCTELRRGAVERVDRAFLLRARAGDRARFRRRARRLLLRVRERARHHPRATRALARRVDDAMTRGRDLLRREHDAVELVHPRRARIGHRRAPRRACAA